MIKSFVDFWDAADWLADHFYDDAPCKTGGIRFVNNQWQAHFNYYGEDDEEV